MNNYIPFLKLKSAEILAIKELAAELQAEITPFFDFPQKKERFTEDNFKKTTKTMGNSLRRHLGNMSNFYLDNFDIDSDMEIDGMNNYRYLLESFSDCPVIPVVGIDRCQDHIDAVFDTKKSGVIASEVCAIRIVPEDFENFVVIADDIDDMVGEVLETFRDTDLIFDCRVCLHQNSKKLALNIINFTKKFSASYPIRKLIVTGSSIPASINEITGVENEVTFPRIELSIFNKVSSEISGLYNIVLGDYGIVSPNYSHLDIMPEAMLNVTAPKILYAFDNYQYVIRGGAIRTHPRSFAQYFDLAKILVAKNFFRGRYYSFGDRFLEEKSKGSGRNIMPASIIKPTVNAHITFMLKDYVA
jgi:hypothetical protein